MRCRGEKQQRRRAYVRKKTLLIAAAVMFVVAPAMVAPAGDAPSTRRAIRCTGMEVPDIPGPRIGRRVIKNGYMGALGQLRLATRLITSPIDGLRGLRGRAIYAASNRKLRLLHGPYLPRGFFVIVFRNTFVVGKETRFEMRHKSQCQLGMVAASEGRKNATTFQLPADDHTAAIINDSRGGWLQVREVSRPP